MEENKHGKMRMESVDMTAQNIDKIATLFPSCITETKGEDGKPKGQSTLSF